MDKMRKNNCLHRIRGYLNTVFAIYGDNKKCAYRNS